MLTALTAPVQRLMLTLVFEGLPSPLFNCIKFYTSYFQKINHLFLAVTPSKRILTVIYYSNGALKTDQQFRLGSSVTLKLLCLDVCWAGFLTAVQVVVAVEVMAGVFMPPPPEENLSFQFEGFFARKLF